MTHAVHSLHLIDRSNDPKDWKNWLRGKNSPDSRIDD